MADPREDEREFGDDDALLPADDIGLDQLDEDSDQDEAEDDEGENEE